MSRLKGLLFYTAADAQRNRWFIHQLCKNAESEGLSLRLCIADNGFSSDTCADFVINRSRDAAISDYFQNTQGIPVFNDTIVTAITNDKYRTHLFLREHGLPTADTILIEQQTGIPDCRLPVIAKPTDGHGGEGVCLISDRDKLEALMNSVPRPFLLQEMMQTSWDLRVYILNRKIYAAVLRTSQQDFRSNFSLGGKAEIYTPPAEICQLTEQVTQILPLDFAGVDFLRRPDGGYVIGEIEDAVGCRMLYSLTNKNPASDFIHMIADRIKA